MAKAKKRADGRYCAQIYLGRDENGKRQYKSVYAKSPAELKEKETAVRLQLGRGLDVLAQRDSFAAWADDWLRLKERERITSRQMDNYRRAVKLWKEELQGYEIGQVRADDIERVLLTLADQGLSQRPRWRYDGLRAYPKIIRTHLACIFHATLRWFSLPGGSPPAKNRLVWRKI